MRHAIDNSWCIPEDPLGQRIQLVRSVPRVDGMNQRAHLEVERLNAILLSKMSNITQGNYTSSTKHDFTSVPKRIASKGEQRVKIENGKI